MRRIGTGRRATLAFAGLLLLIGRSAAEEDKAPLAERAVAVLKTHCHRCHGKDGSLEGGMNYVLDREKLVARKKILPGEAGASPLFKRVASGKMPPPDAPSRPNEAEVELLRKWIDAGAPDPIASRPDRTYLPESAVFALIRDDLETIDKRSRRFTRYFSLVPQRNLGYSADELQTYRNAVAKLLNSLSWHPRITLPKPIDPAGTVLRIDLRDFLWDANLWNRLIAEYPYGVLHDTAVARAVVVGTATRVPVVRADWFIATASRPPLYYDLLQLPSALAELERELRIDAAFNILQERVARAGFNNSGVSRNNRVLERHYSVHGAYWRSYDFEAVPQNLIERDILLPDRRNIFAYPLGPGGTDSFQHAGGEVIFSLPNGLHGFMLVNAENTRIDKGPTAIVSDPKRPDRAVEPGVSCMSCHYTGILPKDDLIRDHVDKNPKAFSRKDAELIKALYVPREKMRKLMAEDAEAYREALAKTGNKVSKSEPVSTLTLRYEADVDLATAAASVGLGPKDFTRRVLRDPATARNLGALKVPGATVSREVFVQSFADVVRALRLGTPLQPGVIGQLLPDNTGEVDPLEGRTSEANAAAFSRDGRLALLASADKSVRLWDVEAGRELRRFIGHTASVWSVAFSPDGRRALSGGVDAVVRLWEVESGREERQLEGHAGLVLCVAFSPDGKRALSAALDHSIILWDLETGKELRRFDGLARYVNAVAFAPDGREALIAGDDVLYLIDLRSGKEVRSFRGHGDSVTSVAFSPDGKRVLSGSDDGTARLWDRASGRVVRSFTGHESYVKGVAFSPNGRQVLTGGTDATVRLWDASTGNELRRFSRHAAPLLAVAFTPDGNATLSASNNSDVRLWQLAKGRAGGGEGPSPGIGATETTPVGALRAARVFPTAGRVGDLALSPNGKWLYYLNRDRGELARIDTATGKRGTLPLPEGVEVLRLTPDGSTLVVLAAAGEKSSAGGTVQLIDARKWSLAKSLSLDSPAYDLAADDEGRIYLSGAEGGWTDVTVLNARDGAVLARWGGVWGRSPLKLSADQKRLYFATRGVSPGSVEALVIPKELAEEKPVLYRSPAKGEQNLGGEFVLTPDGRFLLCKNGTVLKTADGREADLRYEVSVAPFLAVAFDPKAGAAFFCAEDGSLRQYSYPGFKPVATYRLPGIGYQAVCDGERKRLYLAVFDPKSLTARPRGRGGEVHVFDIKGTLRRAASAPE